MLLPKITAGYGNYLVNFRSVQHSPNGQFSIGANTAWHLSEARRFFGELALPVELANAARLDSWLANYAKRERTHLVGKSVALQYGPLRQKAGLDEAINHLHELDRLLVRMDGKRITLVLNPELVGFANANPANFAKDGG